MRMKRFKNGDTCRFFIIFFSFFLAMQLCFIAQAHGREHVREDFFVAPFGEVVGLGWGIAYGGGLSLGYGDGTAIGLRFLYTQDDYRFVSMELQAFFRLYFFEKFHASTGPFVQISGGPVIYADTVPAVSGYGSISAGLSAGWRFPLGKYWFIEPSVRTGYPFLIGGGISTGLRIGDRS
jgi:hypothetical protein